LVTWRDATPPRVGRSPGSSPFFSDPDEAGRIFLNDGSNTSSSGPFSLGLVYSATHDVFIARFHVVITTPLPPCLRIRLLFFSFSFRTVVPALTPFSPSVTVFSVPSPFLRTLDYPHPLTPIFPALNSTNASLIPSLHAPIICNFPNNCKELSQISSFNSFAETHDPFPSPF